MTTSPASWPSPCTTGALRASTLSPCMLPFLMILVQHEASSRGVADVSSSFLTNALKLTTSGSGVQLPASADDVVMLNDMPVRAEARAAAMCTWRSTRTTSRCKRTCRRRHRAASGPVWWTPTWHRQRCSHHTCRHSTVTSAFLGTLLERSTALQLLLVETSPRSARIVVRMQDFTPGGNSGITTPTYDMQPYSSIVLVTKPE